RASDKAMQRAAAEKAEHDRREAERREAERHNDEKRAAAQPQRAAPRASSLLLSEDDPLAPPLQRLTQSDAAHSSAHDPLLESAGGDDELDEAAHEPLLDKAALERERRAEEALARTRAQQKAAPAAAAPAKDPLAALRARRNTGGPPPVATGGTAPGSVQQWLEQQGFSKYLTLFMEMGYDNLTIIRAMGGEDLEGMGITDRVEQRKILMGVSQLNTSARPPSQEIKVPASHLGSRAPASDSKATPTPTKQTSGLFDDDDLFNF
ncbi:MAG: SAM domain-containing protein, partial [archaeon]|nr:SAM domain-containing protein [archaeon]